MIRVCVNGACGKMGSEVVRAIEKEDGLTLVGAVDVNNVGTSIGEFAGTKDTLFIERDLGKVIDEVKPDVVVEFTGPKWVYDNTRLILGKGIPAVVGTTGLSREQVDELDALSEEKGVAVLWGTNFAIGAILMMEFAKSAAKYFKNVEIIEYHHDQKLDAPSGTSLTTERLIKEIRGVQSQGHPDEKELVKGARGAEMDGIHIHSVRLPGFIAHQEVIFGDPGQILTIRHDSMNRGCFMPGVMLACKSIIGKVGFIEGLDKIL